MTLQRPLRRFSAWTLALWLASGAAGAPLQAGDLFDEIYRRGAPIEKSMTAVAARFVETTSSTLLTTALVARGTLIARRPDQVRLEYTGTDPRTVVIANGSLTLDWPRRKVHDARDIRSTLRRAQRFVTASSPAELRKQFEILAIEDPARPKTWQLTFTPKRRQLREGVSRVQLWIDQGSMLLQAMRLDYPSGDSTLMEFSDVRLNPPIAGDAFTVSPAR